MKRFLLIASALLAAVAVSSCNEEELSSVAEGRLISFQASVGQYTKATDAAFEAGDQIGLYAGSPVNVDNLLVTFSSNGFTPSRDLYWGPDQKENTSFRAYYPYNKDVSLAGGSFVFQVKADQRQYADYTASDLMFAATEASPSDESVKLTFDHKLTKFILKVDNQTDDIVREVQLFGPGIGVNINAADGTPGTVTGNGGDLALKPLYYDESTYAWILPPQETYLNVAVVLASGATYAFSAKADLPSGKQVKGNITILPVPEGDTVDFTVSFAPWEEGGSFRFTDAGVGERGGYRLSFRNASGRSIIPMEEKTPGAFYASIPYYRRGDWFYVLSEYNAYIYGCNLKQPQELWENNNTWPAENRGWFELSGYEGPLGIWFYPDRGVLVYEPEQLDFEYVSEVEVVQGMFWAEYGMSPVLVSGRLYEERNNPGLYKLENAFENSLFDHTPYELIIDARDSEKVFLRPTSTFREPWWYNDYDAREFSVTSDVPEVMLEGEQYGTLKDGVIHLGELTASYTDSGETMLVNQNDAFQLVLPGAEREPVLGFEYSYNGIVEEDGIRFASFVITPSIDVTDVRYMFFQGKPSLQEIETDILPAFRQGQGETVPDLVPGNTVEVRIPIFQTGRYTGFFYASAPGTDFWQYYYNYFVVGIQGSEEPQSGPIAISEVATHPAFPESVLTMHVDLPQASVIGAEVISLAAAQEAGITEDDYYSLAMNAPYMGGYMSFVSDRIGGDFSVVSLEPETDYLVIAAGYDVYGHSFWTSATAKTGKAPSAWDELGEGTWIDDMWNTGGFTQKVNILKAQGLERYRAVQPYANYWSNIWPAQAQEDSDLEGVYIGYSDDFDFTFVEDEGSSYIYYLPFHTGYMEKDMNEAGTITGAWELTHYNLAEKHPGSHQFVRYNRAVSDGVYNIAPYGRLANTRSYYRWMTMTGGWTLAMPGAAAVASAPAPRANYVEVESGAPVRAKDRVSKFKRVPLSMGAPVVKSVNK